MTITSILCMSLVIIGLFAFVKNIRVFLPAPAVSVKKTAKKEKKVWFYGDDLSDYQLQPFI